MGSEADTDYKGVVQIYFEGKITDDQMEGFKKALEQDVMSKNNYQHKVSESGLFLQMKNKFWTINKIIKQYRRFKERVLEELKEVFEEVIPSEDGRDVQVWD